MTRKDSTTLTLGVWELIEAGISSADQSGDKNVQSDDNHPTRAAATCFPQ
jgi:hypothetical protein